MVAQVAEDEPDTEPKIPQPITLTCMSLPGNHSSQGARPLKIWPDKRVLNKISPIQMNMGKADKVQLSADVHMDVTKLKAGGEDVKKYIPAQATTPRVMAIHKPPANKTSIRPNKMAPISRAPITRPPRHGLVPHWLVPPSGKQAQHP